MLSLLLPYLLSLWSPGAGSAPAPGRTVRIAPVFGTAPLGLGTRTHRTAAAETVRISTLRFYFTDLRLTYTDGTTYAAPAGYQLVDAEDSASWVLPLPAAPRGAVVALGFTVGVDSATNAAGVLGGALDPIHGMYWAWQSGYINAKLEGTTPSRPAAVRHAFSFHVGGYARPFATRRIVRLARATATSADTLTVCADVARWLAGAPLATTPDVLTPGPAAAAHADRAARMFRWADLPGDSLAGLSAGLAAGLAADLPADLPAAAPVSTLKLTSDAPR